MRISFPEVSIGDHIRVSATTFVTFKRCPAQADARLQGKYGSDSRPAFVGTLAHRVFSRHLSSGAISSEQFVQACREEIGGSGLNHKLGPLEMKPSALAAVIDEVRILYERFVKFPSDGFESSEVSISVEPADGVQLIGSVDAVYREDLGGYRLVDWKTGELGEPEDQLLFYALLWALEHGDLPAFVEAVSVRTGERYRTVPSSADIQRVANEVASLVEVVRSVWSGQATPERRGGPWCRYCPILDDCPEGQSVEALLKGNASTI